jgi:hypothetical protein
MEKGFPPWALGQADLESHIQWMQELGDANSIF